jgi:2,3-bisphosphoglycerate-dependent phosphoglycerate mutase
MVAMDRDPPAVASAMRSMEAAFLVGVPGATEVWLVRHGDCYDGIASDAEDPPLSEQGRDQARRLAGRINRLGYDAVYASPLRRARETARAITPDVRLDERLVEVTVEVSNGHVEFVEDPGQVLQRMRAAVAEAVAAHAGGRVIMVGHGVSILNYLCDVLRLDFGTLRLLPYYTSVNVVRVLGDRRMVGSLADVAHLES